MSLRFLTWTTTSHWNRFVFFFLILKKMMFYVKIKTCSALTTYILCVRHWITYSVCGYILSHFNPHNRRSMLWWRRVPQNAPLAASVLPRLSPMSPHAGLPVPAFVLFSQLSSFHESLRSHLVNPYLNNCWEERRSLSENVLEWAYLPLATEL